MRSNFTLDGDLVQDGKGAADVMVCTPACAGGLPVKIATIKIEAEGLLVEPWMIEKVMVTACKQLSNLVLYDHLNHKEH